MKTVEELLKPRAKVIAPWPSDCYFKSDDILVQSERIPVGAFGKFINDVTGWAWIFEPEKYPANLRMMEWWEELLMQDMPLFLKGKGVVCLVEKYNFETDTIWTMGGCPFSLCYFLNAKLPATEQEYKNYING